MMCAQNDLTNRIHNQKHFEAIVLGKKRCENALENPTHISIP